MNKAVALAFGRHTFQTLKQRCFYTLVALGILSLFWLVALPSAHAQPPPATITATTHQGEITWVGTMQGLWRYEQQRFISTELPFLDAHITALYHDGAALWVGTNSTIGRYTNADGWQTWQKGDNGLPSAWATAFATYQGQTIVGTYDRGAFRWDGQQWSPLPNSPLFITQLASDNEGLWLNTREARLYRYQNEGQTWQEVTNTTPSLTASLTDDFALAPTPAASKAPVVLVHGLGDSNEVTDSNLRFLARWLRDDGYPVYYVAYSPDAPLLTNTESLAATVLTARSEHANTKPIIIAHSFGGLVARLYLAQNPAQIEGLVTLGTPNAGARLAYDFIVTGLADDPAIQQRELLPEHTELLEPFWGSPAVPQLHVGGNLLPQLNFFQGFPPHDGIVDAASAVSAPGATRIYPLLHGWTIPTLRYGINSYLAPETLYLTTIRPFLAAVAEGNPPTDRALSPLLTSPGFTQRPLFVGDLAPNETRTFTLTLDAEPATWLLDGTGVTMTLTDPNGTRYDGSRARLGTTVTHLPYRENVLQPLDLWSTAIAGTWQVELVQSATLTERVRLAIIQPQRPALAVRVVTPWVAPSERVIVEVEATAGQTLTATLGERSVPVAEVEAGLYRATLTAPASAGYHALRVSNGSEERWTIATVRTRDFQVNTPLLIRDEAQVILRLPITGNGRVAVGVRIRSGDTTLANSVQTFSLEGRDNLAVRLAIPATDAPLRIEWRLFAAEGALLPITPLREIQP